jgi:hypothetical protein
MYPVREVLCLVVLGDRKYSMRISVSALTLRGGKSPGGAHDVEAALRQRIIAERDAFSRYAGVGPIDRNAVEAFNFREIRSNIA